MRIHPESQRRRYVAWLEEIRPWCISRQLWWGHQIPVWYRGDEVHVGTQAPEGEGWTQDPDVLDTWFSSALWPFATLGWPEETPELRAFYPTAVLSTARDILFLWVARMVMMGLEFMGDVPFRDVYVHSVIQAPDGRRMSKSLGTGIDPLEEIDRHGADAVRFGLLAMSSTQDVKYSAEKVAQGQALANKLFNASRFVLGKVAGGHGGRRPPGDGRGPLDPLAPAGASRPTPRRASRPSTSPRSRSASTTSSTASCATGTWSSSSTARSTRTSRATLLHVAARDAGARAPGHPVRHRGAVGARVPGEGEAACWPARACPGSTPRCATRRPRRPSRPSSAP